MVSVIVPAYNAEGFLHRCLDSILAQTYTDLEVVLVNDGSRDGTFAVMERYATRDHRIRVVDQQNAGVAAARNVGLRNASGDYILYVDADDWIEPDTLERLLAAADAQTDIVFCCSDHAEIPEDVLQEESITYEIWDGERQRFEFMMHKRMSGMLWNKLIRRSITEGCTFDENVGYGEDAHFLWQVLKNSRKMIVTNEILYHHVLEGDSISNRSFSEKKYSAIPMWEGIVREVTDAYPELVSLAKERLMCAAVFSCYEIRQCGYRNRTQVAHMRKIVRENILFFVKSQNISVKFKLYACAVCLGF